ncbi:MAG: extracellular solute-binding protein, partial [Acidimicrobiia bacterium]
TRRLSTLLVGALGISLSCGGSPSGERAAGKDQKPLDVWIMEPGSEELRAFFDEARSSFVKEHPGVEVEVQFVPWASAHDQFATAIGGDQVPDLAEMGSTWTAEFASVGTLAEVPSNAPESVSGLVQSATVDSKVYGLPWYAGARALIYRKDVLDKLGLKPPTTWDELVKVGRAVQAGTDMHAFGVAGKANHFFLPLVWQKGGSLAELENGQWRSRIGDPKAAEAVQFYADLYAKEHFAPEGALTWNSRDVQSAFEAGDLAMMVGGGWDLKAILAGAPDLVGKVGTVLLPEGPAGNRDSFAGGSHLVVFESSARKELARSFASHLLDPARLTTFADRLGFLPATLAGLEHAASSGGADDPNTALFATFVSQLRDHSRAYPATKDWGRFEGDGIFANAVQQVMAGKRSAAEAMREVAADMNTAFEG